MGASRKTRVSVCERHAGVLKKGDLCQSSAPRETGSFPTAARILLVDHDHTHAEQLTLALEQHEFQVTRWNTTQEFLLELGRNAVHFDLVMLDLSLNRAEDLELFDRVRRFLWAREHGAMILCFSRVNLGPMVRLRIERKGARLVYER